MDAVVVADQFGAPKESDDFIGLLEFQFGRSFQFHAASLSGGVGQGLSKAEGHRQPF
jgi:hypothetical protein